MRSKIIGMNQSRLRIVFLPEPLDFTAVPGPAHVAELGPGVPGQQAVAGGELGILPQFTLLLAFLLELGVTLLRIKLFDFITAVSHVYPL